MDGSRIGEGGVPRPRGGHRGRGTRLLAVGALSLLVTATGCVTVGDFRREMADLERRTDEKIRASRRPGDFADVVAKIDELNDEMRALRGRLEVAEKTSADALAEARRARQELAARSAAESGGGGAAAGAAVVAPVPGAEEEEVAESDELVAYRTAYAHWREGEHAACIDGFREFLRTYPSSEYSDDAAFWMADCHFKQGDYKNAVLRFDDVVKNYPTGNKAPDALYRQGESLLRLGPGFHEAAKRAFERVVKEYPDSARAPEAEKQIKLLATG